MTLLKLHRQLNLGLYSLDLTPSAFWVRSLHKGGLLDRRDRIQDICLAADFITQPLP
ncbi:hypothetical protein [uncultured Nostoc sp.]|uniref:hypothetical protein n=1 Tax=uncultured Nostoc sp. TaxID=340711 RepID=UPI0035CBDDB3